MVNVEGGVHFMLVCFLNMLWLKARQRIHAFAQIVAFYIPRSIF